MVYQNKNKKFFIINYLFYKLNKKLLKKKNKSFIYLKFLIYFIYKDLELRKLNKSPYYIILKAIKNISPLIKLKKKKIAGRYLFIPIKLSQKQSISLGLKFFILSLKNKKLKNFNFFYFLFNEIKKSFFEESLSFKKKEELHKLTIENKYNIKFL